MSVHGSGGFKLIRAARLIDGNGGPPLERGAILIEGDVPNLKQMFPACPFAQRCPSAMTKCSEEMPPAFLVGDDPAHRARCWLLEGDGPPP